MKDEHDQSNYLWHTRINNVVKGPFTVGMVRRFVLIGRMSMDDEVSQDKLTWRRVKDTEEVIPYEMRNITTDEDRQRLLQAQLREDERSRERRRADLDEFKKLRRRTTDRRNPEDMTTRMHREIRNRLQDEYAREEARRWPVYLIIGFIGILAVTGIYIYMVSRNQVPELSNCDAKPAAGVNWNHCQMEGVNLRQLNLQGASMNNTNLSGADLRGTNLSGSDLSYANLSITDLTDADLHDAQLKGAGLRGSILSGANLANADLSYADLRGAKLDGAQLQGAFLNKAFWLDGSICGPDSVGKCIPLPKEGN